MVTNDFEVSMKRHIPKDIGLPSNPGKLYQAVAFYASNVEDEIGPLSTLEKMSSVGKKLKNKRFVFPFYSEQVFLSETDVKTFLPLFVKDLIKKGHIPSDVVLEDNSVDSSKLELAYVILNISLLEKDLKEFRNEND